MNRKTMEVLSAGEQQLYILPLVLELAPYVDVSSVLLLVFSYLVSWESPASMLFMSCLSYVLSSESRGWDLLFVY
jgi:hypothetical protein